MNANLALCPSSPPFQLDVLAGAHPFTLDEVENECLLECLLECVERGARSPDPRRDTLGEERLRTFDELAISDIWGMSREEIEKVSLLCLGSLFTSPSMPDDWVFSFSSFDDPDDEEFDQSPISSGKGSVGTNGTAGPPKDGPSGGPVSRPQMTKEERLKDELDISTRADPAIFQKTPWTVAKLNALSRAKTTAQRHDNTLHPMHKSGH
ncbi:9553_t:CDS:2, partial [Acaulospora colombiana]